MYNSKFIPKSILLILIILSFQNCQKDNSPLNDENSNKIQEITGYKVKLADVRHRSVEKTIIQLANDLNQTGILRLRESDNVEIKLNDIKYYEYANTHTYTFKLTRDNPEYLIENIVLHYNNKKQDYDEYLVQYDVSGDEFLRINENKKYSYNKVIISKLEDGTYEDILNRGFCRTSCSTFSFNCTAGGDHDYSERHQCNGSADQLPFEVEICNTTCYDTGGGATGFDEGTSGGGGSGGATSDDVVTSPSGSEPCQTLFGEIGIADDSGCITTVNSINRHNLVDGLGLPMDSVPAKWILNTASSDIVLELIYYFDNNQNMFGNASQPAIDRFMEIVTADLNGTLISAFPLIKYPEEKSEDYKRDYPKLTEYLKNKLPSVSEISIIVNAIQEMTQLPKAEIKESLKWNQGPTLNIIQLDNYPDCSTCSEETVGYFDENNPNNIYLDIDYANMVENGNNFNTDNDAFIFFIGTTILHEFVHWGEYSNDEFTYYGEEGWQFELMVYGTNVNYDNARAILNRVNN